MEDAQTAILAQLALGMAGLLTKRLHELRALDGDTISHLRSLVEGADRHLPADADPAATNILATIRRTLDRE